MPRTAVAYISSYEVPEKLKYCRYQYGEDGAPLLDEFVPSLLLAGAAPNGTNIVELLTQ